MLTYRLLDATCPLPTCLHGGPLPLTAEGPAYVETTSDIAPGSVATALRTVADRYGACGILALEGEVVVGKLRFYPQSLLDAVPVPCVQQAATAQALLDVVATGLPSRQEQSALHLFCLQVAPGYAGRGIARGLLDTALAWAREQGWQEVRARAVSEIPPLLDWCGQLSRGALERRGFEVVAGELDPNLLEGVVAQRAGAHGAEVARQWDAFADVPDAVAAQVFAMTLTLGDAP